MKKLLLLLFLLSNVGLAQTGLGQVQEVIFYSGGNIGLSSSAVFVPMGGGAQFSAVESQAGFPLPMPGIISNMYVRVSQSPGAGKSLVFTLRNNSLSQSLTCTIQEPNISCSDISHAVSVLAGDLTDWQIFPAGGNNSIGNLVISVQFSPSTVPGGIVFLCQASTPVASLSIGPCNIPSPPAGTQWRKIIELVYVSGYGAPGDTVGDRYNGDSGANYRFECNTMAAGGTTFAAGTNTATSQSVLKLAPADSNLNRNILAIINNDSGKTEKTVQVLSLTGTGSVTSQAAFDLCNGAWVSPAAGVNITSVTQVTLTANMGANSGFALFGIAW